jgi:hypothetical protein
MSPGATISYPQVRERYVELLSHFMRDFPDVDEESHRREAENAAKDVQETQISVIHLSAFICVYRRFHFPGLRYWYFSSIH